MFQGPTARVLTGAAAAVAGLALATPAWAASGASLNPSHKGSTAANFQQECTDKRMAGRQADQDGWHFVLPGGPSAGDFASLSLTFNDGVSDVYIAIPDAHDAYPDAFYEAGGRQIHAYLFTPAGWTLKDGKAKVTEQAAFFNLSHTCAGTPTTPTPEPSTPAPTPSTPVDEPTPGPSEPPVDEPTETPSVPVDEPTPGPSEPGQEPSETPGTDPSAAPSTPAAGDEGGLPVTGAAAATIALVGLGLVGGGAAMVMMRRRKVTFTS